jgi:PPK2 family polyphosphate:nucleotide phosphotransferase
VSQATIVKPGTRVRLKRLAADYDGGLSKDDPQVEKRLERAKLRTRDLQTRLYAESKQALLVVLQAMDAGGKDGTIKHVMEGVNPQACSVMSFKAPTDEELAHDFLWRIRKHTPAKGNIAVFNRSHYEDVLIVRVHNLVPKRVWRKRYDQINAFERLLVESGTHILKLFLYISKEEQKRRLEQRLADPKKRWKFNPADLRERELWDDYMAAYEEALARCSTDYAPWHVIPADRKWYRNLVVAELVAQTLRDMNPRWPKASFDPATITIE